MRRGPVIARRNSTSEIRLRPRNPVTLNVVDTDFPEFLQDFLSFDALGDGLQAYDMADVVHRGYDRAIRSARGDSADERAVNLQVVHSQSSEVAERRQSLTEI